MRNGLSKDLIARVLGGAPKYTVAELEAKFPPRNLGEGVKVTRFAPSPTGYMHLGNLYSALISYKLAQQSGGVFLLRIENTDTKRENKDAVDIIINSLAEFGITYENDPVYGPYYQSERKDIYHSVAADLLARGLAYPCFLTQEEMDEIRENQKAAGFATGIYGEWARDRDLTEEEIIAYLDKGFVPSIRLYSMGNPEQRIFCKDAVRGSLSVPEHNEDTVLIKSTDGLPTYHFAHLCDDHFMHTTHVVRDESYFGTFAMHVQMFRMMGWELPAYVHIATLDKIDDETGKQRKLSKRKDPEANVAFFLEAGWPVEAVIEYLGNIAASGYEEAKMKGQVKSFWDYEMRAKKIPMSGALFDMKKLDWYIFRKYIGTFFFSISLLILIVVVFDVSENIDSFIKNNASFREVVLHYYVPFIPYFINLFIYLFVFISVIFFTSKMAGHTEIIAILSSGISFKRFLYPYMLAGLLLAAGSFYLGNFLIPKTDTIRREFKDKYMEKLTKSSGSNIHVQIERGTYVYVGNFDIKKKIAYK